MSAAGIPATLEALAVPIDSLKPYARNARRGNLAVIVDSLERHGQYRPVVARAGTGEVLAGNHTLAAAKQLGWPRIAATFVEVDDDQAARIVLIDNRANDVAGYDDAALAEILGDLGDLGGTGFEEVDLEALLASLGADPDLEADTKPGPAPSRPRTTLGDLYYLGEHRLLCGDAASIVDHERLRTDAAEYGGVITDPPYGVEYVGKTEEALTLEGDGAGASLLTEEALGHVCDRSRAGAACYLFHPDSDGLAFRRAYAAAGWDLKQVLIWVKQHFVMGRQDYQWQHEPILYGWKPGAAHYWAGGFAQTTRVVDEGERDLAKMTKGELRERLEAFEALAATTVIREDRPMSSRLHPTMKPVALIGRLILNSTRPGDRICDPFGGAGSTLIACENAGRAGYLLEIDPAYCDVIVDRWERHTGGKARLERALA